jgi:hypothetical protein
VWGPRWAVSLAPPGETAAGGPSRRAAQAGGSASGGGGKGRDGGGVCAAAGAALWPISPSRRRLPAAAKESRGQAGDRAHAERREGRCVRSRDGEGAKGVWDHGPTRRARASAALGPGRAGPPRSRACLERKPREAQSEPGGHVGGGDAGAAECSPVLQAALEERVRLARGEREFTSFAG